MDHSQALSTHASERYLLGDMSEPERFDFEAHYFDCGDCAEDVRAGTAFARGVRAVCAEDAARPDAQDARGPRRHVVIRALILVPFLGYQWLVTIPQLRSSRALSPIVLRAAARGDEQIVELRRGQPYSILSLDVNAAEPGAPLVYEVSPQNGSARAKGATEVPRPGSPLLVMIPSSDLDQAGQWTLVLRTPQGTEISRFPFVLKLN